MPSPKHISLALVVALASHAASHEVRAAQGQESAAPDVASQPSSPPDEARIASDLGVPFPSAGARAHGAVPGAGDTLDSTAIRSSVRKGEVLEYRVTSVYRASASGDPWHEVDSTVSYRKHGDKWALLGVQIEGSRAVAAGQGDSEADC